MSGSAQPSAQYGFGKTARASKPRACAECRRLKLRCDRNFPCQSCIRRGCSALCPDRCFTEEATPSSLKASSLRNRQQIESLKQRVADLEEALAANHPSHDLLKSQGPASPGSAMGSLVGEHETAVDETVDIFGSLSIGEDGTPVFHGATSLSENFVQKCPPGASDRRNLPTGQQPILPSTLQLLSALFPFAPQSVAANSDINEMLPYLPSAEETFETTNLYWHHFSMGGASICRQHFVTKIYNYFYPNNIAKTKLDRQDAHRLGVLFITLALGVLTDLKEPMLSTQAELYHQLARASLSLDPVCDNPTIHGLQCMLSIASYMRMAPTWTSPGYRWAFGGILLKLSSSMGIFRDSRRWLTDTEEIEQREVVCWELVCLEVWNSFTAGRPCSLDLTLIDCRRPPESATPSAGLAGFIPGFTDWRYRFFPLVNNVLLVVQRPGPVKYTEILKMERQLRECPMPDGLEIPIFSHPLDGIPDDALPKHFQRFVVLTIREGACCLLHRRFLVLAMQQDGDDPRRNPFWYSAFQAGYSACCIVRAHIMMYRRHPDLISRVSAFWSTSFSAAVILGAIVARYWNRDFARGTLSAFEDICALFREAAGTSIQPLNSLEILERLQQRVRAQFPTSSDAEKSFNDLPLLGAQPSIAKPALEQTQPAIVSTSPIKSTGNVPMPLDPSFLFSVWGNTGMVCPELNKKAEGPPEVHFSLPELKLFHDNNAGGVSLPWTNDQEWQPNLPEGVSNAPLDGFTSIATPSGAEVGQWNHFLDRLGVWE